MPERVASVTSSWQGAYNTTMRLAVLTTSYPVTPDSSSGIFVARLVENLPPSVCVTVVTPAARMPTSPARAARVSIKTFRYAPWRLQVLAHEPGGIPVALRAQKWTYLLLPGFLVSMFLSCLRHARASDVIHANWAICGCIAGVAGKLLGVPVITTLRGDDVTRAGRGIVDRIILSLCVRWSSAIVGVSHAIDTTIRQRYPRHADKICAIENGVDDAFLKLNVTRDISRTEPAQLLNIGSLISRKGVDRIIMALHRLPQRDGVSLSIVGDGPERGRLIALVNQLGLQQNVNFMGALPPAAVLTALAKAHVFVLASSSEGRPNVVLEAMAAAVPVIASDIPGVSELVTHGLTGLLFQVDSVDELAVCIQSLIDDAALRQRLGRAGRDFILQRRLRWSVSATRYYELYRGIAEPKQPCAE